MECYLSACFVLQCTTACSLSDEWYSSPPTPFYGREEEGEDGCNEDAVVKPVAVDVLRRRYKDKVSHGSSVGAQPGLGGTGRGGPGGLGMSKSGRPSMLTTSKK